MEEEEEDEGKGLLPSTEVSSARRIAPDSNWRPSHERDESFRKAKYGMYGSHFLSAWGQRMWEFGISLVRPRDAGSVSMVLVSVVICVPFTVDRVSQILLDLGLGSLILVAIFGLLDSFAVVLAGPPIGTWIDRTDRLRAGRILYAWQSATIAASAALALGALTAPAGTAVFWIAVAAAVLAGAASSAAALGATLAVEKEWAKTLCGGDSVLLASVNAGMRRIDLGCLILSPILVGFLMTFVGARLAILSIVAWDLVCWAPQWLLLRFAWSHSAALREPKGELGSKELRQSSILEGLWQYKRQEVCLPALALALLYLTVLSFGLLATAYLKWSGMSEAELSLYRGFGALAGVTATWLFPLLQIRIGLTLTGVCGIGTQLASLAVAVAPAAVSAMGGNVAASLSTRFLVGGLVVSRLGLWLFDLSVGQLLQERVAKEEFGAVSGTQGSLASLCQGLSYAAALACPDPENFTWLMLASWGVVLAASALYGLWAVRDNRRRRSGEPPLASSTVECT